MALLGTATSSRNQGSTFGYGTLGHGHVNTMSTEQAQQRHDETKARLRRYMSGDYS